MIYLLELDACFKSLLKGTQWRNEQFVCKTNKETWYFGTILSCPCHSSPRPDKGSGLGMPGCLAAKYEVHEKRDGTIESAKPLGGGDQRYSLCPGYDEVSSWLKCEIGSLYSHVPFWAEGEVYVYRTFGHWLNSSSTASMFGVAKFAWAILYLGLKELTRNQGWCSSMYFPNAELKITTNPRPRYCSWKCLIFHSEISLFWSEHWGQKRGDFAISTISLVAGIVYERSDSNYLFRLVDIFTYVHPKQWISLLKIQGLKMNDPKDVPGLESVGRLDSENPSWKTLRFEKQVVWGGVQHDRWGAASTLLEWFPWFTDMGVPWSGTEWRCIFFLGNPKLPRNQEKSDSCR